MKQSPYCELQCGCRVISLKETDKAVVVVYVDPAGVTKNIKTPWLIGADGKTGVIRKQFLEPIANIRQEVGLFAYNGTWVAANLHITLPTPQSHPELCFWAMDMTPEDVYDLFWPDGWHFCSPPGKATACGRFGPREARLWRHEFAEPDWDDSKDAVQLMWEHLTPLITRESDSLGRSFPVGAVTFPRDCIRIQRCRSFTFCQKVVNKWFYHRTILIGDAAHVFPPFGGQGIACGIRDGDALAWRLAVLSQLPVDSDALPYKILQTWSLERRDGVDKSIRLTKQNGMLCNGTEDWPSFLRRIIIMPLLALVPGMPSISQLSTLEEKKGYRGMKDGFFLTQYGGGGTLSQMYVCSSDRCPILSDGLLQHGRTVMTLLVLNPGNADEVEGVKNILTQSEVPLSMLSKESVVLLSTSKQQPSIIDLGVSKIYQPCSKYGAVDSESLSSQSVRAYVGRFTSGAKYIIIRPDLIIFSVAKTFPELEMCLGLLNRKL